MAGSITVKEAAEQFGFKFLCCGNDGGDTISNVYVCDLLSWVMGRAPEGGAWITIQGHTNIVAVAMLTGVSCVIIAEGADADADTIKKAVDEGIPILSTTLTAYQAAALFAKAGVGV